MSMASKKDLADAVDIIHQALDEVADYLIFNELEEFEKRMRLEHEEQTTAINKLLGVEDDG